MGGPLPPIEGPEPPGALLRGPQDYATVTAAVSGVVLRTRSPRGWVVGFAVGFLLVMVLFYSIGYLFTAGVGIWGINIPVAWGFDIINFVWWIGIGHAGTLISAVLLLMRQRWRTSINRFAEAMTLFAVACAGLYPLLHLGRPQVFYWLLPYPSDLGIWPQFRSPLVWDIFAVLTYFTVSLLFWYVGMLPDLATMRDRARRKLARVIYGVLALGWRGSARHWARYDTVYLLLAGLATPLVVSVHSIVGLDFAVSLVPGWHSTVFPPYFVAGAIYSGFAMVLTLILPIRAIYKLHDLVTERHITVMAKVMLATGLIVAYGYLVEHFFAWYSASGPEEYMAHNRMTGPYAPAWWALMATNVLIPQALWFRRVRGNVYALFGIALAVNVGMWLERFIIIVTSLHREYLPSEWGMYYPTVWDWATFLGTIGLFVACMFLFVRLLPMIAMSEVRHMLSRTRE